MNEDGYTDEEFLTWLSGFIASKGEFEIDVSFKINRPADDTDVLDKIQRRLGMGGLHLARGGKKFGYDYRITGHLDCLRLVEILDQHTLLLPSKLRAYQKWREVVIQVAEESIAC